MRNRIKIIIMIGMSLIFLTGCPYNSIFTLSDPNDSSIDSTLLGTWICTDNEDSDDTLEFEMLKFNEHEYLMEYQNYSQKGKAARLRVYTTTIKNTKIANVTEIGRKIEYDYFKYIIKSDELIVSYASNEFINKQFQSQSEIIDFFNKNIDDKDLFEGIYIFKRK